MAIPLLAQAAVMPTTNTTSSCLQARQDSSMYETEIEIGPNTVTATWIYVPNSDNNPQSQPYTQAFTDLFDNIYNMCGTTQCGLDASQPMEYCTTPVNEEYYDHSSAMICLQAMGSFPSVSKDDIFSLGRTAFDGSVKREYKYVGDEPFEVDETGASFIHVITGPAYQGGSGFDLTFNLFLQPTNEGCGPIVDRITDAGLVLGGQFAPVFGLIGLVCGA